jgi:predicted transcriptional regulator
MEISNLKVNKSQIARELGVDRRTVDKYLHGFQKAKHRSSRNCLTDYYDIIQELLADENVQLFYSLFYYKRIM